MPSGDTSADVAVVGAGAVGLSIAWRAAQRGLSVTVVDDGAGGASWAAAGMIAPVTEVWYGEEPLLALNLASAARWPDFAGELGAEAGADIGYRRCGTVLVARDADEAAALGDLHAFQTKLGLDAERLGSRELRRLEPGLSPRVRGGILVNGDHQVDNRALLPALRTAATRAGARVVHGRAASVTTADGRVTGLALADGHELPCGQVVLAAGAGTSRIGGLPVEALPPVRPVKGQLLHLRGGTDPPLARRNVRGVGMYVVPRADGRVVVGSTVEERGDTVVTAGAVFGLLRDAWELLPDVAECAFVEATAGLRPGSPDNAPVLGPSPHVEGLAFATGHYRHGLLLTPVTADAVSEWLATGSVPDLIAPFGPARFAPPGAPNAEGAASGERVPGGGGGA